MNLFIFFLMLLVITCTNLYICSKVYAPPVVLGLIFLFSYAIINYTYGGLENEYAFYSCFMIAVLFFSIGFYTTGNKTVISSNKLTFLVKFKKFYFKIFWIIEYLVGIIQFIYMIPILLKNKGNAWHIIRKEYEGTGLLDLLNLYIIIFVLTCFCIWLIDNSGVNKKRMLLSIPAIIPAILSSNRGTWFMLIIAVVFIVFYVKRLSNIKTLIIALISIATILGLFFVSSIWKYSDYINSIEEIFRIVSKSYFSTQFVAFREKMEWIKAGHGRLGMGENTFRFFVAIGHSLGFAQEPVDTVQRFMNIYGYNTNVYTGLSYYATDFGMWWAYFIEFILGMIYGYLFKRVFRKQTDWIFGIIALSILMYPLINQFFDDRYFSVLSQWIKQFFFLWIFTRKNVLIIDKGTNDYEK